MCVPIGKRMGKRKRRRRKKVDDPRRRGQIDHNQKSSVVVGRRWSSSSVVSVHVGLFTLNKDTRNEEDEGGQEWKKENL